ncbi:MAG TPA: beta-L-arabinofuranosidase domain-containing protein [Phycisphaerae bacterium]|nr:beta-L-arabinofuranosidase domain-containing protein [Phycisphaerae bacterium]
MISMRGALGAAEEEPLNIAVAATPRASFVSGHESLAAINDGYEPRSSADHRHGAYGNWPQHGTKWVEYDWNKAISTNGVDVYWWDDHQGVRLPVAGRVLYWDGNAFVPVKAGSALGVAPDQYNSLKFDEVTTTRLRLEIDAQEGQSSGIIEWKVYDSGKSPAFPPTAHAGPDRVVVMPAVTYLQGSGKGVSGKGDTATGAWSKEQGPGDVTFEHADEISTTAKFSAPGDYVLKFSYTLRGQSADDRLTVHVEEPPAVEKLKAVYVSNYQVSSPFWREPLKNEIVHWIPHCIETIDEPNLPEGGINNIIEAGKKLRGEPSRPHVGYPFSNAWVLNTVEAMSVALTVDAQGDQQIIDAQNKFRAKLDEWIPLILAAQEPDGYFQTRFTLGMSYERAANVTPKHWNPATRGEHEGYIAGYFIEAGIANYIATQGKDRRLYDAAIKLADCWCANLGPAPKKTWFDGHQEVEQALVRLGRFVNDQEGGDKGRKYIELAKFLLGNRGGGSEYDQSYAPVWQQYQAVGHAVRAAYTYSALADVCMETGDPAYWSAMRSIWDNLVNRKYYVTGGIGSGETSEGFGGDYSLPSASAYVESCSSCGLLFMQYKLNLATRDAKYADLYETTLYNAILGDVDLAGENFTYTNSLDSSEARYKWHVCPCCVGNIPRTLLMLPTWMYATAPDELYVNLYAGTRVNVGKIAGTAVVVEQTTNYPWDGNVKITLNPAAEAAFAVHLRSPRREVSTLYTDKPIGDGITTLKVNGESISPAADASGYVTIHRTWKPGDVIEMELPLPVEEITASNKVASTRGRVALRRGPLLYNVESVDQNLQLPLGKNPGLQASWMPDLLGGVVAIRGAWSDGSALLAVPNYARLNRGGRSLVWMKQ